MIAGLGERLKTSRMRTGLSQEQVAELIGKQSASLSVYETDSGLPSLAAFMKMAGIYKVSADWLLGIDTTKTILVDDLSESDIELLQRMADIMRKAEVK